MEKTKQLIEDNLEAIKEILAIQNKETQSIFESNDTFKDVIDHADKLK
ncbi:MAG: hypothetical protein RR777_03260 [Christensenellaceae bacterium]